MSEFTKVFKAPASPLRDFAVTVKSASNRGHKDVSIPIATAVAFTTEVIEMLERENTMLKEIIRLMDAKEEVTQVIVDGGSWV